MQVKDLSVQQCVAVSGEVVKVGAVVSVTSKRQDGHVLKKQDCVLADCNASVRIVFWEGDVNRLVEGQCYKLSFMIVKLFNSKKFLSMSQEAAIAEIADIGNVVTSDDGECSGDRVVCGLVIGVQSTEEYCSCILCNAKVEPISQENGRCSKCLVLWRLSECSEQLAARLVIKGDDKQVHRFTAFKNEVIRICASVSGNSSYSEKLMEVSEKMKFTANHRDIIVSVEKA